MSDKLSFATWYLIGYEEYIAGYNAVVSSGKIRLAQAYTSNFQELEDTYFHTPIQQSLPCPNFWHFLGMEEAFTVARQFALYPPYYGWKQDLNWPYHASQNAKEMAHRTPSRTCSYCTMDYRDSMGVVVVDFLQDHNFCSIKCAQRHREALADMVPQFRYVYKEYALNPLPLDWYRLLQYLSKLPPNKVDDIDLTPVRYEDYNPRPAKPVRIKRPYQQSL